MTEATEAVLFKGNSVHMFAETIVAGQYSQLLPSYTEDGTD